MATALFNRFTVELPDLAVAEIAESQADNTEAVQHWEPQIDLSTISTNDLRAELAEYGAWGDLELADHQANRERVIWLAAWYIKEDRDNTENYRC